MSVLSVIGLTPPSSPLAAQDIQIDYETDSLLVSYRQGFGSDVGLEISTNLASWLPIQVQDAVIEIDSAGETITSSLAIGAVKRLFFRLSTPDDWNVTLQWDAPLDHSISGYNVHYGTASGSYTGIIDVTYFTRATISLPRSESTYFVVVTAYNAAGLESEPSNELELSMH
jgi:hypothetical protein